MSLPFQVHVLLKDEPEVLAELEKFAREPGRTIDECHEWLLLHQYTLSRSAVGTWKKSFDEQVMKERFSRSGELAAAIKGAVQGGNFDDVADAAVMQLTQVVFEQAAALQADGDVDPLDVQRMTRSLVNLVGTKEKHTRMLAEKFEREMERQAKALGTAKTAEQIFTPQRMAEARRRIFGV